MNAATDPTPPNPPGAAMRDFSAFTFWPGIGFGVLTIVFLIALVAANMAGYDIPCASRLPVILIFSLCAAFSAGFLGGYLTASGQIAIPGMNATPLQVGTGGGIAVLLVFPIVGWFLYVKDCGDVSVPRPLLQTAVLRGNVAQLLYDVSNLPPGYTVRPQFSPDQSFRSFSPGKAFDSAEAGHANVGLPADMKSPCWVRIAVYDRGNHYVSGSESEAKELTK